MNSMDTSSSYTNTEIKKNNGSGSTLIIGGANNSGGGTSAPTGSSYVSDPSTIFECSRCHQLFKDMSQFQVSQTVLVQSQNCVTCKNQKDTRAISIKESSVVDQFRSLEACYQEVHC